MSDKLRSYVEKNRKELDSAEPSKDLWNKIDSQLEIGSQVKKGKWIFNLKYFGFGAGVLLIAVYFITQHLDDSSSKALVRNSKDSALNSSGIWVKENQNDQNGNENKPKKESSAPGKNESIDPSAKDLYEGTTSVVSRNSSQNNDSAKTTASEANSENKIKNEEIAASSIVKEEKTIVSAATNSRKKISAPETPAEVNIYSGSLYEGSLCAVLQAYKFPGKANMDDGNYQGHRQLKTIPCSRLENVKAVWIKGKTSRKITLTLSEGFKNIVLQKSDGRKIFPVAISHYYAGLGVISGYSGRHFDMTFKDKVELILFFKDAEAGDKVIIDETIEAVVK